mgnify:CR=1 FL=1
MVAKHETWMPLDIGAYLGDTMRLTTEQHGAYLLILMNYWRHGPPPDDDEGLAAITKMPLAIWKKTRTKIEGFFRIEEGHWHQKRADEELAKAREITGNRSEAGKAGARGRWGENPDRKRGKRNASANGKRMANAMANECETVCRVDAPLPLPKDSPKPPQVGASAEGNSEAAEDQGHGQRATGTNPRATGDSPRANGRNPKAAIGVDDAEFNRWKSRLARYRPGGFWLDAWGDRPESGNPGIPAALMADWKQRIDGGTP